MSRKLLVKLVVLPLIACLVLTGQFGVSAAKREERPTSAPSSSSWSQAEENKLQALVKARIKALVERLRSARGSDRRTAQQELERELTRSVDGLSAYVDDKDQHLRARLRTSLASTYANVKIMHAAYSLPASQQKKLRDFEKSRPKAFARAFSGRTEDQVAALNSILPYEDSKALGEPIVILSLASPHEEVVSAGVRLARTGKYRSDALVDALTGVLLRAATRAWDEIWPRGGGYDKALVVRASEALQRIGSRRAAPALVALATSARMRSIYRDTVLMKTLAAIGEKRAILHLFPLLYKDEPSVKHRLGKGPNSALTTMATCDAALMAMIELTDQDASDYGFTHVEAMFLSRSVGYGFRTKEQRTKAIRKFLRWWDEHKRAKPYRDLKELDLPNVD